MCVSLICFFEQRFSDFCKACKFILLSIVASLDFQELNSGKDRVCALIIDEYFFLVLVV